MLALDEKIIVDRCRDKYLSSIIQKVASGNRLSFDDGVALYNSYDILTIGMLANMARKQKVGDYAYFIHNVHLNPSNICSGSCRFCAYRKKEGEAGAFRLTLEEIEKKVTPYLNTGITEIHLVSALDEKTDIEYYKKLLSLLKQMFPNVHIQGFTAVEIDYLAKNSNLTIECTLNILQEYGLDSLPGGGAEVFSPRLREKVCPEKISGAKWLDIMRTAHNTGIHSNATMLAGIGETYEERVSHLLQLRELQDETNGFMSFIPLSFHSHNTELKLPVQTGIDDIKNLAVSRLILDNFNHIKAFWIQLGVKLSQVSLHFGVDDLDGTVMEEHITHDAGAQTGQALLKDEIVKMIKEAGRIPVQRDTLYNVVKIWE